MDLYTDREKPAMRITPILLLAVMVCTLALPALAADNGNGDMLKKAQKINTTVPQKGTALLGTKQSMTDMSDWLNECSSAITSLVNDVMGLFGLGSTDYGKQMTQTLQKGVQPAPSARGT